jgi:hypothetical protein
VREVGATPVLRTSRVGFAALVAPTSRTPHIQRGYFPDLRWIQTGSVQRSALIYVATETASDPIASRDVGKRRSMTCTFVMVIALKASSTFQRLLLWISIFWDKVWTASPTNIGSRGRRGVS